MTMTFDDFYAEHQNRVLRILTTKIRSDDRAEDAAQEVWLRVAKAWATSTPTREWLNSIVRNVAVLARRGVGKDRGLTLLPLEAADHLVDDSDLVDQVSARLRLQAISRVLNAGKQGDRDLLLSYLTSMDTHGARDRTAMCRLRTKLNHELELEVIK